MRQVSRLVYPIGIVLSMSTASVATPQHREPFCSGPASAIEAMLAHMEESVRRQGPPRFVRQQQRPLTEHAPADVAVLIDDGGFTAEPRDFDLQQLAIRFEPTSTGYRVTRLNLPLYPASGNFFTMGDDDSVPLELGFMIPFYGERYSTVYINSDGNVTFQAPGPSTASGRQFGPREILLMGPPRIAPLLTDLGFESAGFVSVGHTLDRVTVTWKSPISLERSTDAVFQATLWSSGRIDFTYDGSIGEQFHAASVGIGPGGGEPEWTPLDFSETDAVDAAGTIIESFRAEETYDVPAITKAFYRRYPDIFDQLILFSSRSLRGSTAFYTPIKNEELGNGTPFFDATHVFGSAGRLRGTVMINGIERLPRDPTHVFDAPWSTLSLLAHELGHRWMSRALLSGPAGARRLLTPGEHWVFTMHSPGKFHGRARNRRPWGRPLSHFSGSRAILIFGPVPHGGPPPGGSASVLFRPGCSRSGH